jgi:hypothetical protein
MRPVDVPPVIRSAPKTARELTEEQVQLLRDALRGFPYAEYLQSAWWRERRNRSLQLAEYRCQQCGAKRDLQVHHVTYERLGAEEDGDLEVLCRGCHEGEHPDKPQTDGVGIFIRVVSDVLSRHEHLDITEILEDTKALCAQRRIPYAPQKFNDAVNRLLSRFPLPPVLPDPPPARESRPLTHKEAVRAITQYNAHGLLKPMPAVPPPVSQRTADRTIAARMVAQEIVASVERCEALERAVCAVPNPIGGRS